MNGCDEEMNERGGGRRRRRKAWCGWRGRDGESKRVLVGFSLSTIFFPWARLVPQGNHYSLRIFTVSVRDTLGFVGVSPWKLKILTFGGYGSNLGFSSLETLGICATQFGNPYF